MQTPLWMGHSGWPGFAIRLPAIRTAVCCRKYMCSLCLSAFQDDFKMLLPLFIVFTVRLFG